MKAGTHSPSPSGARTAAHTPKQGRFGQGRYHYPRSVPHVRKPPRAGCQNGVLCRFWVLAGGAPKERREPAEQRALMRVAVPRRRGPAGLRDSLAVSLTALMGFTVLVSRIIGAQKIERLFFSWYKISIAPEAYRKPRKLCLFLL